MCILLIYTSAVTNQFHCSTFSIAVKCFASLPRTTRGKALVLNGDPKGKNMLYTNGNSVIIREVEV